MASRLELQKIFEDILGTRQVYYQPPESIKMSYPAILYFLSKIDKKAADDSAYIQSRSYEVIFIDTRPDSKFVDSILALPMCRFDRCYRSDNLYHYSFTLYF